MQFRWSFLFILSITLPPCSAIQAGAGPCSTPWLTPKQLTSPRPRVILGCLTRRSESRKKSFMGRVNKSIMPAKHRRWSAVEPNWAAGGFEEYEPSLVIMSCERRGRETDNRPIDRHGETSLNGRLPSDG
ncbi:hypothetical protein BDP55DRAFT_244956 [Colletotrichum godetiae]|uniref:Secreted protein n=1 Tax=Colletotrichum godetiae TaxID=1209918 RepID=A0AAJ0AF80_9PEZI|nr:uncharacterized protein BDP55DRAFT_244956 [Colletotrichum godetiae]KAK1672765.1 hypothetical protein BDP55DRAFT_244956 [Colletotrichum godetiae]